MAIGQGTWTCPHCKGANPLTPRLWMWRQAHKNRTTVIATGGSRTETCPGCGGAVDVLDIAKGIHEPPAVTYPGATIAVSTVVAAVAGAAVAWMAGFAVVAGAGIGAVAGLVMGFGFAKSDHAV